MVSFVHGSVIFLLSSYQVLFAPSECGDENTNTEYFILTVSGGFFTYDLFVMAWYQLLDKDMHSPADIVIHHMICIGGVLATLAQNMGAGFGVQMLFMAEVSCPAMHMRVILRNLGKRYTLAYELSEYAYFISFFVGRVIMGHPVVYSMVTCQHMCTFNKFAAVGILLLSYMYLYRMRFIMNSRIKETTERKSKGIENKWFEPIPQKILEDCAFWQKSQKVRSKLHG